MENVEKTPEKQEDGSLSPILKKSSTKLLLKRRQLRLARENLQRMLSIESSDKSPEIKDTSVIDKLENMELRRNSLINQLSTTKPVPPIKIDIPPKPLFISDKNPKISSDNVPKSPTIQTGSGQVVCISDKNISEARKLFSDILDVSEHSRNNKFNYLHQTSPVNKQTYNSEQLNSETNFNKPILMDLNKPQIYSNVGFSSSIVGSSSEPGTSVPTSKNASIFASEDFGDLKFDHNVGFKCASVNTALKSVSEVKTTNFNLLPSKKGNIFAGEDFSDLPEGSSETVDKATRFGDLKLDHKVGFKSASFDTAQKSERLVPSASFRTATEVKTIPNLSLPSKMRNIFASEDFSDLITSEQNLPGESVQKAAIFGSEDFKDLKFDKSVGFKNASIKVVDNAGFRTPIRHPMSSLNVANSSEPERYIPKPYSLGAKENIHIKTPVQQGFNNIFAAENFDDLNLAGLETNVKKPPVKRLFHPSQRLTNDSPFKSPLVPTNPNFHGFFKEEQRLSDNIQNDFRKFITSKNRFFAVNILQNQQQLKRKLPTISPVPRKKHLGVSFTPTVKISQQGLQSAKLIFEDVTPSRVTPELKAGFTLCRPPGGSILDHLRRERELLQEKLRINEERTSILLQPSQFTKITLGVLSKAKQTSCLSVQSLQPQFTPSNTINPQNAHLLHFSLNVPYVRTQDGACIVPYQDKVGFEEIRRGFEGMEGVDTQLIPDKWVANHFKWIVWKLASYERFFGRECLTVENVVQQLKFRYDVEIDQAKRPILRKIFEKDDSSQRRLVLCVSKIIKTSTAYELELTDGWYPIRTTPDGPLQTQIAKGRIQIGLKLLICGAELHHAEPCHPLEAPPDVRLRIYYNSTRRVKWWCKLGAQKPSGPFLVPLYSVRADGGKIGCIQCYIYRVYPVQYVLKHSKGFTWKNKRAHEVRPQQLNVKNIIDGRVLYDLMQQSGDPEGLQEMMSTQQKQLLYEHAQKGRKKCQDSDVTCVLKLKIMDGGVARDFSIWNPDEGLMDGLKEGEVVSVYNATCSKKWGLMAGPRTHFQAKPKNCVYDKWQRRVTVIGDLKSVKPMEEFDTVGVVVEKHIGEVQHLWVAHKDKKLLLVTINYPPSIVLLLDHVAPGQQVAICNLTLKYTFATHAVAYGDHRTLVTKYPQQRYLKEAMDGLDVNLEECKQMVARIGMDVDGMECSQMTMTDLALMESVDQLI